MPKPKPQGTQENQAAGTETGATETQEGKPTNTNASAGGTTQQAVVPVVDDEYGELLDAIDNRVEQSIAPIREQNAELRGRLEQMNESQYQSSKLFGGAPGVRIGEDPLTSRGYQYSRAYGVAMQSGVSRDNAKVECELSNRLRKFYVEQNGMSLAHDQSLLVPFGSSEMHEFDSDLASEVRQMLHAGVAGADQGEAAHAVQQAYQVGVRQALSMFDDTALGVFSDPGGAGELISMVRNREIFSRAGASQLTLPPNGFLKINKQTGAATGYWVGESASITESEQQTGSIELRARKSAALVKIPNELVRFGTPSVEAFIRSDIARVLSLLADLAFLEGPGSTNQPKGLVNYSGIVSYTAGTVGANGNTLEPEDPAGMLAEVEEKNHDPEMDGWSWAMRAKMWKNIRIRRTDAVTAADAKGGWLFDVNRSDIANGQSARLEGWPVVKSAQISNTHVKGSSSDLTYILGGIFRHFLIANAGVMEFTRSTEGDTPFVNDQTWLKAIRHVDAAPRYEDAFVMVDSIDMDLPA